MSDEFDIAWAKLLDPDLLKTKRKEAEKYAGGLATEDWKTLRKLCKSDLFFLANTVLGYNKLSPNLHGHLCRWSQGTDTDQFREYLLPRGHFKSTIQTIADGIRIALPDDAGDAPWPRCLGTNCRVLIAHETHDAASRFLFSITQHFTTNPMLMGLFPECVPNAKRQRVNRHELELPRSEIWSEPTFDTMGVGGRGQGRHYNFLKLDDLFGDKARDSAVEREATYLWFDNIQSFFSSFNEDHLDLIGTRWAFDDLYSHAHGMYADMLKKYIRSCEEADPKDPAKLVSIFPEMFPPEKLTILKKRPKIWQSQYVNNPSDGLGLFDKSHKRYFKFLSQDLIGITTKLFGVEQPVIEKVNLRDCDIVFLIDPAMSGLGGYIIAATDRRSRVFVIKAKKQSWKPPELVQELFDDVMKYQPRIVAVEAVTFSEIYRHWVQREMQIRGKRFNIVDVRPKNQQKEKRINGLSNWFSSSLIFFNELELGEDSIDAEYDAFGASQQIHLLDALAYYPEVGKSGGAARRYEDYKQQEQEMLDARDTLTGYSA